MVRFVVLALALPALILALIVALEATSVMGMIRAALIEDPGFLIEYSTPLLVRVGQVGQAVAWLGVTAALAVAALRLPIVVRGLAAGLAFLGALITLTLFVGLVQGLMAGAGMLGLVLSGITNVVMLAGFVLVGLAAIPQGIVRKLAGVGAALAWVGLALLEVVQTVRWMLDMQAMWGEIPMGASTLLDLALTVVGVLCLVSVAAASGLLALVGPAAPAPAPA